MGKVFKTERRVEFCETDAAGIAHFSAFFCYMEQAEHAFLRALGTSVVQDTNDGWHLSWPRVHAECDYAGVARFEDLLQISIRIVKLGNKSVSYRFEFQCEDRPIATGSIVAVCCKFAAGQPLQSVAIPEGLKDDFASYLHVENS